MSWLLNPIFSDEGKAIEYVEKIIWVNGVSCPKCGALDSYYDLKGKTARIGLKKCKECKKEFSVRVNSVFQSSHIPMTKWLQAIYLQSTSKKGISSHQLHRVLEITYKSAWFLAHRIREAMRQLKIEPMGGENEIVEVDETFLGNKGKQQKGARGYAHKEKVLSLVQRNGEVRSFHVDRVNAQTLKPIIKEQIKSDTTIMTDEANQYKTLNQDFKAHHSVEHGIGEYVRGSVHTNTIEGFFSIFKRGMKGIYQHCSKKHLKRYLCEFDFRYNNRKLDTYFTTNEILRGVVGKRLMYRDS